MRHDFLKGSAGMLATAGGIAINHAEVNAWLQTISLFVGIAVGVATFLSIVIKNRNKKQKPTDDDN